jgi:transcriptional regulator with XRE-family HTH domain
MRHSDADAIGGRLARARRENGLTQEELAALVGVSPRSIQGYEAGKVVPYRHLSRLAQVTNRELNWLLEGEQQVEAVLGPELAERLVSLVEEVAAEATRIRAAAERLERLLEATQPTLPARQPSARGSDVPQ